MRNLLYAALAGVDADLQIAGLNTPAISEDWKTPAETQAVQTMRRLLFGEATVSARLHGALVSEICIAESMYLKTLFGRYADRRTVDLRTALTLLTEDSVLWMEGPHELSLSSTYLLPVRSGFGWCQASFSVSDELISVSTDAGTNEVTSSEYQTPMIEIPGWTSVRVSAVRDNGLTAFRFGTPARNTPIEIASQLAQSGEALCALLLEPMEDQAMRQLMISHASRHPVVAERIAAAAGSLAWRVLHQVQQV